MIVKSIYFSCKLSVSFPIMALLEPQILSILSQSIYVIFTLSDLRVKIGYAAG